MIMSPIECQNLMQQSRGVGGIGTRLLERYYKKVSKFPVSRVSLYVDDHESFNPYSVIAVAIEFQSYHYPMKAFRTASRTEMMTKEPIR